MIVITGATEALNGATVNHLLSRVTAEQVAVSVRDMSKAAELADRGVQVRQGTYEDPAALTESFTGADRVLLVSPSDPAADAVALLKNGIDAAIRSGVGRLFYTSHQGAHPDSPFGPARDHAAVEKLLAESGLGWTSLRNGFYTHSLDKLLGEWRDSGVITAPADGPVSWTARADEAEAAAVLLASEQTHDGPVTSTAGTAVTFEDIAAIASGLAGKRIFRAVVDDEERVAWQCAHGTPELMARFSLSVFQAARNGLFAGVDPLLQDLLGRKPKTVEEFLARRADGGDSFTDGFDASGKDNTND